MSKSRHFNVANMSFKLLVKIKFSRKFSNLQYIALRMSESNRIMSIMSTLYRAKRQKCHCCIVEAYVPLILKIHTRLYLLTGFT